MLQLRQAKLCRHPKSQNIKRKRICLAANTTLVLYSFSNQLSCLLGQFSVHRQGKCGVTVHPHEELLFLC